MIELLPALGAFIGLITMVLTTVYTHYSPEIVMPHETLDRSIFHSPFDA